MAEQIVSGRKSSALQLIRRIHAIVNLFLLNILHLPDFQVSANSLFERDILFKLVSFAHSLM